MKKKITVVHHSNQFGLGGTEKDMLLFCKYHDKDVFDVHAVARKYPVPPHRLLLDRVKSALGSESARARDSQNRMNDIRVPDFLRVLGEDRVHFYRVAALPALFKKLAPSILHVHHNGETQIPLNRPDALEGIPLIFTINGFGFKGESPHQERISRILFPSNWVWEVAAPWSRNDPRCGMLYCPIEKPHSDADLRAELGIKPGTVVFGRVGRNANDIHHPISLNAYKEVESENTLFLALAPPPQMIEDAKKLGIRNIRWLEPTVDEVWLSRFYNTIDALAHARLDGETFGCAIAEAMIHGRPVITHRSHLRNAQAELLDADSGFVTDQNDINKYAEAMRALIQNADLRRKMGEAARRRALANFEAGLVTRKLEAEYFEYLKRKNLLAA